MTNFELIDVGAQAERTALAWQRTGIGIMAVGALLVRWGVSEHLPVWPGVLLTVLGGVTVAFLVPGRYRRVLGSLRAGQTPLSRRMVPGTALLITLVIVCVGVELAMHLRG